MALQVWLPLTKDLRNQGLSDVTVTNNGATFNSAGKLGGCYSFGTGDSYITVDSTPLKTFTEFSFACWVKIISWNTSYSTVFAAKNGTNVAWNNLIFSLLRNSSNSTLCFNISNGSSCTTTHCQTGALSLNTWHHITCTYKSGEIKLYQDGNVVSTYNTSIVPNFNSIVNLWIGKSNANSYQSNNLMNDVRIYDHCLSPMEVKELSKGLVLHYPLNREGWGQENLFIDSTYEQADSSIANSSTDWSKYFRRYNGSAGIHSFSDYTDTITLSTTGNLGVTFQRKATDINLDSTSYYTISCEAKSTQTARPLCIGLSYYNNSNSWVWRGGSNPTYFKEVNKWQKFTLTFKPDADTQYIDYCFTVTGVSSGTDTFSIRHCKLEKGSIATPWCPNSSDNLAAEMGLNGTTEYDTSGYCNNGTRTGTFSWTSDTPKYQVSTTFPASGNNYINIGTQLYNMKDEMTVSIWAKANDWTSTSKGVPFSSVEGGGFGWQASSANYVFYCGSGTSSNTYLSSTVAVSSLSAGWHMLSATYDGLALKIYIDGELKNTVTKYTTKTPIYYNTNSGMFVSGESGGSLTAPNGSIFRGNLSDLRIYATALSADDVKSLYQNCATIDVDGTVHGQIRS